MVGAYDIILISIPGHHDRELWVQATLDSSTEMQAHKMCVSSSIEMPKSNLESSPLATVAIPFFLFLKNISNNIQKKNPKSPIRFLIKKIIRKILRIKTILRKILRISVIIRIRIFVKRKILILRNFLRKTTILRKILRIRLILRIRIFVNTGTSEYLQLYQQYFNIHV